MKKIFTKNATKAPRHQGTLRNFCKTLCLACPDAIGGVLVAGFSKFSYPLSLAIISTALIYLTSCTKDNGSVVKRPPSDTIRSFKNDIQPIFDNNCATSGCHASASPAGGMNLEVDQSYNNIVNIPSTGYAPVLRVKPSDADSSVLWNKDAGTGNYGIQMPPGGPYLKPLEIDDIKTWIDQGAENN